MRAQQASLSLDLQQRATRWVSATSPLYTRAVDGRLEAVGTGVFFEHRGRGFVITASHVLTSHINSASLLIGGSQLLSINQRYFSSVDEDAYDVGFIPLTDAQRAALSDARFLTIDECERLSDEPKRHYLVGYRADDNEPENGSTSLVARWSVYAVRSAPPETYSSRGESNSERLLLSFDRRLLLDGDGPVEPEPEPEGLSGAGVWQLSSSPSADRLVAIIESHTNTGKLMYASGLGPVMHALDQYVIGALS